MLRDHVWGTKSRDKKGKTLASQGQRTALREVTLAAGLYTGPAPSLSDREPRFNPVSTLR